MMKQTVLTDGRQELMICILRSKRKTLGLQIRSDGEILARVPAGISDREVIQFLEKHRNWIFEHHRGVLQERENALCLPAVTDPEMQRIFRKKLTQRLDYYADRMGVTYGRVSLRNQKTRWGSCSSSGNLNFNCRLAELPEEVLDYVVVHELAHRKHMNHSKAFWEEVERYQPGYRKIRQQLKTVRIV